LRLRSFFYQLAVVLPFAAALRAGTVQSNTVDFDLTSGLFNNTSLSSSFTPFDTALGTLTGVDAIGSAALTAMWSVSGFGQGTIGVNAGFEYLADLQVAGQDISQIFFANGEFSFGCTATAPEVTTCSNSGPMNTMENPDYIVSPTVPLSAFTGVSNIPFFLIPTSLVTSVNLTGGATGGSASYSAGPDISGSIFLLYTYTPATLPTPEPSSIMLLGVGLALLAGVARARS
jgi:hypothetical protein